MKVIDVNKLKNIQYSHDGSTLFKASKDIKVAIVRAGVETISDEAFKGCDKLHTVILPDSLKTIGVSAFEGCRNLRWINIPKNVKQIKGLAFNECSNLRTLYLPNGLKTLGEMAFMDSGVRFVTMPIDAEISKGLSFSNAKQLTHIIFLKDHEDTDVYNLPRIDVMGLETYPQISIHLINDSFSPQSRDGILARVAAVEDEETGKEEDIMEAVTIPDNVVAIPDFIQSLPEYCMCQRQCPLIFIPSSVNEIMSESLPSEIKAIVTPQTNLNKLISILPTEYAGLNVYTI